LYIGAAWGYFKYANIDYINMGAQPVKIMVTTPEERVKILQALLENTRNTMPIHIEKGINLYRGDQENYDIDHLAFLNLLEYMFGPTAGKNIASTFWRRIA
jgi:hypothetical protein